MSNSNNKKLFSAICFTVFFILFATSGCTQDKGVMYIKMEVWNPDSTASFEYKVYSVGPPAGYKTIEIEDEEILRYGEMVVIYGGWYDNQTIKILSSDLPIKNNTNKTNLKVKVEKADSYDDYKRDSYLIHLSK